MPVVTVPIRRQDPEILGPPLQGPELSSRTRSFFHRAVECIAHFELQGGVMKVAIRASLVGVALLGLALGTARAAEPFGFKYPVKRTAYSASFDDADRSTTTLSQATEPEPQPEPVADPMADAEFDVDGSSGGMTTWDDAGGCDSCGEDCGGSCGSCGRGRGLWYGGVDYLLFRPRYSAGIAAVRRQDTTDTSTFPTTSTSTDTVIEYPFDYSSGFRVAAGYRLIECGGDFQVAYWRMVNDASVVEGPADISTNNPAIAGNLKNNPGTGQFLNASTGVTANIFDADFTKCISMGGPCNPCDTCFCPRWDLRFFVGARAADISRYNNNVVTEGNGDSVSFGNINARFVGAGPRIGFQSRRYIGQNGFWSVYGRGAQAILIGEYNMSRTVDVPSDGTTANQITNQFDKYSRTIPVTDIEVGLSWQAAPFTFVSVGYFWQCWWDLGQSEPMQGTSFGSLDTSNILGFDGLFVRGEMLF
jgi:hypothetical protein